MLCRIHESHEFVNFPSFFTPPLSPPFPGCLSLPFLLALTRQQAEGLPILGEGLSIWGEAGAIDQRARAEPNSKPQTGHSRSCETKAVSMPRVAPQIAAMRARSVASDGARRGVAVAARRCLSYVSHG